MPDKPDEVQLSFFLLRVAARGRVAFIVSVAIAVLLVAVAWKVVQ